MTRKKIVIYYSNFNIAQNIAEELAISLKNNFKVENHLSINNDNSLFEITDSATNISIAVVDSQRDIFNFSPKIDVSITDISGKKLLKNNFINHVILLCENHKKTNSAYFSKPFSLHKLNKIVIKYCEAPYKYILIDNKFVYDEEKSLFITLDETVKLTNKENELLNYLINNRNNFMDKREILKDIWNYKNNIESSTLETHIYKLKQKLPNGNLIARNNSYMLQIGSII